MSDELTEERVNELILIALDKRSRIVEQEINQQRLNDTDWMMRFIRGQMSAHDHNHHASIGVRAGRRVLLALQRRR